MDRRVALHTRNTVVRVQVLVKSDLEHGEASLPGNDSAVRQEEHPDPVPLVSVLGSDEILVGDPVLVPAVDGGGVVHAEDVDVLDFEVGALELGSRR